MPKVLGISSSPRIGGNSDTLLNELLRGSRDAGLAVEKISLANLKMLPCSECGDCKKRGICTIKDDVKFIYDKLKEADSIVIAAPIFFGSLPAQMKIIIDRCQAIWIRQKKLDKISKKTNKTGIFLAVAGSNRKFFFENAKEIIKIFFKVTGVKYSIELFVPNVEGPDDIKKKPLILKKVYDIGKGLADKI